MSEVKGTKMERLAAFMKDGQETKKRDFLITKIDVVNDLSNKEKYVNVASAGILKYPKHPCAPFSIKNLKKTYFTLKSIGIDKIDLDKPNLFIRVRFVPNTISPNVFKLKNKLGGRKYIFNKIEFKEGSNQLFTELLVNLNYLDEEKQLNSLKVNIDEDFREIFDIIDPQEPFDTVVIMNETKYPDISLTGNFELKIISLIHDLTSILTRCNKTTSTYTLHFNIRQRLSKPCDELAHEKTELKNITNELKELAKFFDIPVITAQQLNRNGAAVVDAALQAHDEGPKHRFNPKSGFPEYKPFEEDTDENVTSVKVKNERSKIDRRKDEETMKTLETNSETESESGDNSAAALAHFFKFLSDTFDD